MISSILAIDVTFNQEMGRFEMVDELKTFVCLFVCFFLINGVSWPIREEVECNNMTSEAAGELRALCHAFSAPLAGYDCSIPVSDYFDVVFYRWHKSLSLAEEYLTL